MKQQIGRKKEMVKLSIKSTMYILLYVAILLLLIKLISGSSGLQSKTINYDKNKTEMEINEIQVK